MFYIKLVPCIGEVRERGLMEEDCLDEVVLDGYALVSSLSLFWERK
jgi:hypothetical protein